MATTTFPLAGRTVSRVGYGAMQLPGPGVFGPPRDRDEALAVLRRAVERGVNHIDTAQFYGPDVSNELIRTALAPYPDDLVIVTKIGARRDGEGNWLPAQTPKELRASVEENLEALGLERLDAVNLRLHGDDGSMAEAPEVALDDQMAEMIALREEGKIASIGISTASLEQVAAVTPEITCVQNPYSLLDRHDEDVLDHCTRAGVAYVPYFPLGSAFPGMPKVTDDAAVQAVAARHGATPAQVGLAWLLARAENVLLIPGTSSRAHLDENLAVADVTLTDDDLAELTTSR
ncbi:oxidoreductase [Pseudonocardia endophytica]|uniref:Aryl-alcohol dehydrogenase-like predicted oxidoreductase n=1 Tax=Pseudonocardia endophytica TaxID=401976 RepID=A0A4R1HYA6_PSEEN|nr:oxidoreductase [Pseudonocardia endophytica]TCK25850.1 aryl-alcohol dehydrogenase-like predicted oxidoreductase [Pseudonocardia endophytica]